MIKTLRISDKMHKEILKIQGEIQAQKGTSITMDEVITELVRIYKKKPKS